MESPTASSAPAAAGIRKAPTGVPGLDEITAGGLPAGRPTLICGSAGCGKTLMAMEFLVRGATEFGEPGVFVSFEEGVEELTENVRSLGFDLDDLMARGKLLVEYIHVERSEIEETGEYDLEGLFIRLGFAIDSIGARRVVLDTLEILFGGLQNESILRAELRRLFRFLKEKGVTAVITGERGEGALTRNGLEEYVSDCVILLDHRVTDQLATRRLRVVKYRGSIHGTNEYPFLIDERGIEVLPVTSLALEHDVSTERVSSGIEGLDEMLDGRGYYRGSSILVSGRAGTGKTSLASHFAHATCARERCLYFAFEESRSQVVRNMRSIGVDLQPWVEQERLIFHAARPTLHGLERHLVTMYKMVRDFRPGVVIVDPITNFLSVGTPEDVKAMLMRLIDFLKINQITSLFTSLTHGSTHVEQTEVGISSLMDTWLLLRENELSGERNRTLYVLKSRGMPHSNQLREVLLTDGGIRLVDVYLGPNGALTGAARVAQEAQERAESLERRQEIERRGRELERKREAMEARIASLRLEFEAEQEEIQRRIRQEESREDRLLENRKDMARARGVKVSAGAQEGGR